MTWLCKDKASHYSVSRIPKRRGGFREINAPDKFLRLVQARIYTRLLSRVPLPDYTWAFEPGKSVPDMAKIHVGKKMVISLDIKDFFPSITQKMIQTMLAKEGIAEGPAARTISELCTYKWYLPQGGITSPKISNLIVKNTFGNRALEYCNENGLDLTVYADDLTMSEKEGYVLSRNTNGKIVICKEGQNPNVEGVLIEAIIYNLSDIIRNYGNFRLHHEKTKIMLDGSRKTVCGVVVNERTNLTKKERLRLRAMVHNVCKNGIEAEAAKFGDGVPATTFVSYLRGRLNWFHQLNSEKAGPLIQQLTEYLNSNNSVVAEEDSPQETEVA